MRRLGKNPEQEAGEWLMVKSLQEIDMEFSSGGSAAAGEEKQEKKEKRGRHRLVKIFSDLMFYAVIAAILVFTLLSSQSAEKGKSLFGFSIYNVLTPSMQSELPVGSLTLVKKVDTDTLQKGDTITFFMGESSVVTHKIVDIYNNYNNSGQRGFQTKGVMNAEPDSVITYETNVIGRVVAHIPALGQLINFVSEHMLFVILVLVCALGIVSCLKYIFTAKAAGD